MTKNQNFIETKEYKRFAEFCDACIKYQGSVAKLN